MNGAASQSPAATVSDSCVERRIGLGLTLLAIFLYPVLLWRGWGAWNDVLVDFGRELYVPWRITEGEVLYRDIAYFNGPLSPYWNALWFLVAGVSLQTLTIVNVIQTALFGWLLHTRTRSIGGPIAAGVTLLAFELIFACGHYPGIGNYNFIAPYSHELTHGLMLGLLAFTCALRARSKGANAWAVAVGLFLGLGFLTKAEIFVATGGAIAWILILALRSGEAGIGKRLALMAGTMVLVPTLACCLLATAMPFGEALYGTLGSWTGIFASQASELFFYKAYMGIDRIPENLGALFSSAGKLLAIIAPAALLDLWQRRASLALRVGLALAYAAVLIAVFARSEWTPLDWLLIARFMPLFALVALVVASVLAWRKGSRTWGERAGFALFAFLMTLKMILIAMLAHYGFALAVAGAALFAAVLLGWVPRLFGPRSSDGLVLRVAVITMIGITASAYWLMSEQSFSEKTITVGSGQDSFRAAPPRAVFVNDLLGVIDERVGTSQTVLVMPEGIMANYLSRRRSPTRHVNFMPPELELFGEEEILRDLREAPPAAAVVLVHKDTSEYGFPLFGTHYGEKLMRYATRRYQPDWLRGDPPLQPTTRFGIGLLGPR